MTAIKVENVVIFPEKSEFLVNRGMRSRMFIINQGKVMVRLEGFENYYLCLKSGQVFSKRKDNSIRALKKLVKGGTVYYMLFVNGAPSRVALFQIFKQNLKGIEQFFNGSVIKLPSN